MCRGVWGGRFGGWRLPMGQGGGHRFAGCPNRQPGLLGHSLRSPRASRVPWSWEWGVGVRPPWRLAGLWPICTGCFPFVSTWGWLGQAASLDPGRLYSLSILQTQAWVLPAPTPAGTSLLTTISSSGVQGIYPHGWACSQPQRTVVLQLLQVQTRSIQICRAGAQGCAPALLQNAFSSLLSQKYSSVLNAAEGMAKFRWGTTWLMPPPADPGPATEVRPAAASLLAGWSTRQLRWISGEGLGAVSPTCLLYRLKTSPFHLGNEVEGRAKTSRSEPRAPFGRRCHCSLRGELWADDELL